ncbi:bacterio-opsin activator, partial [Thermodesulfovibrio thiophilus]|uniref:bacterio-opsin activator n=1 Tax=Thermodesulfovibrio thiophilus TaxID=340095 RepID=UPI0004007839
MVKESEVIEVNIEARVQKLFLNAIELLGGLKQLCDYRSLTWLPALARAAYAVVLKEEYNKTDDEIAQEVGLSKQSVRNILQSNPELVKEKIKKIKDFMEEEGKELRGHIAGAIVKLAYNLSKEDS